MDEKVKQILREYLAVSPARDYKVFITWKCKVLQNFKWLLCTTLPDQKYYEITYNGDKMELYIDEYEKASQAVVVKPFVNM